MKSCVRRGAASKYDSNTVQMMKLFRENVRKDITGTNDLIIAVKERLNDCDLNLASMKKLTNELNLEFASIANKVSKLDMTMKKARTIDLPTSHHRTTMIKQQKNERAACNSICSSSSSSSLSSIGLDDSGKCPSSSSMVRSTTCNSMSLGGQPQRSATAAAAAQSNPNKRARRAALDKPPLRLKSSTSAHSSLDTTLSWTTGSSKEEYDHDEDHDANENESGESLVDNGYGESLIDHDDTFNDIDDDLKSGMPSDCRRPPVQSTSSKRLVDCCDQTTDDDDDDDDNDDQYTDEDDEPVTPLFKIRNSFDDKLLNENCNKLIESLLQNTIAASL